MSKSTAGKIELSIRIVRSKFCVGLTPSECKTSKVDVGYVRCELSVGFVSLISIFKRIVKSRLLFLEVGVRE